MTSARAAMDDDKLGKGIYADDTKVPVDNSFTPPPPGGSLSSPRIQTAADVFRDLDSQ